MFEIVFLGTSASAPSIYRGLSSAALLAGEDRFLIDCGEGTQRQILRSGIGFKRLNRILLTHQHLDHILGIGGLVSTFARWESLDELHIWGSAPTLERVEALIYDVVLRRTRPSISIHLKTVEPGIIYRGRNFSVRAFPVQHRGPGCFGYVFEEDTRRPFLVDVAESLGVPAGPERSRLVRGESITLADGREIRPEMVLGDPIPGLKVAFTGDLAQTQDIVDIITGADALVIEGTFLHRDVEIARQFGHITAREAAELARDNGVRSLLLTHVSRRYREAEIIDELKSTFPDGIVVRDLDHYAVRRDQPLNRMDAPPPVPEGEAEEPEDYDAN